MRFKIASISILLAVILSTNAFCAEGALQWVDYSKVFKIARDKDKPVLLYFYMPGCQYCKTLNEKYFVDEEIGRLMKENFVLSRIDITAHRDIATEFEVMATPTIWLLDEKGERIVKMPGLLEKAEYKTFLEYAGKGWYKKMDLRSYLRNKSKSKY